MALGNPTDLVMYHLASKFGENAVCIFVETLVDRDKIERLILRSLLAVDVFGDLEHPEQNLISFPTEPFQDHYRYANGQVT